MVVKEILENDEDLQVVLKIIRDLGLKDAWLAAGSLRNLVWNHIMFGTGFDNETDVDVIFFDFEMTYEETLAKEQELKRCYPKYRWELKNQVYMHQHNPHTLPYTSSCDAVSKYPEKCTAIAARLRSDNSLDLFLPYGEEDVINFLVAPTPHFSEDEDRMLVYQERLAKKNWHQRWPRLKIVEK